jgi:hypothetical protein
MVLVVCETLCDRVSGDVRCILSGRDMGVVSRVVSSHTICCRAYLSFECCASPESLVYAVRHGTPWATGIPL